jgi:hypothetical protein
MLVVLTAFVDHGMRSPFTGRLHHPAIVPVASLIISQLQDSADLAKRLRDVARRMRLAFLGLLNHVALSIKQFFHGIPFETF